MAGSQPHGANKEKVVDLLCQALQSELGRALVVDVALRSAQHERLRDHWERARSRSASRIQALRLAFRELEIPMDHETPGRETVRRIQESLLAAMEDSLPGTALDSAQLIAADCVVVMEAKTDACWRLIRLLAKALAGERGKILKAACARVDADTDMPLSAAWTHELWLKAIGLAATLPPPAPGMAEAPAGRLVRSRQARA